jgi:hypothetical protein
VCTDASTGGNSLSAVLSGQWFGIGLSETVTGRPGPDQQETSRADGLGADQVVRKETANVQLFRLPRRSLGPWPRRIPLPDEAR